MSGTTADRAAPRESDISEEIAQAIGSRPDVRLWRNNVGAGLLVNPRSTALAMAAEFGIPVPRAAAFLRRQGRYQAFGVPGSADRQGLLSGGRFLAVEVKASTGQTPEQRNYQSVITLFGGLYVLARSVQDVQDALTQAGHPPP